MKRTIPELRTALREIATELEDTGLSFTAMQLRQIADEMKRNPPSRPPAPTQSRKLSEAEKRAIREFAMSSVGKRVSQMDMATKFGTNIGRISEALRGA